LPVKVVPAFLFNLPSMKKIYRAVGISSGLLLTVLLFIKVTGAFSWVRSSTPSNEPTLKTREIFFSSNLISPGRGNFILYNDSYIDSVMQVSTGGLKKSIYVKRLCAVPGDVVEMKKGVLYVNGKNFDEQLNLMSYYYSTKADLQKANYQYDSLMETDNYNVINTGASVLINLTSKEAALLKREIKLEPYFVTDTTEVFKWWPERKGYTVDNFGPFKIPGNCYFVLGDNRQNSMDSRYTGLVTKENIKSVVLWK
jgi:signal peptidase I